MTVNLYRYLADNTEFLKLYIARATVVAKSRLRDFRSARKKNPRAKIPYYRRPYVIVDSELYKIIGTTLLIGIKPRQPYVGIPLNHYTMKRLSEPGIKTRTITITPNSVSISITKDIKSNKSNESIGIDINLNNIVAAHSDGKVKMYSDMAKITRIKEKYRNVKSHFRRNDARIKKKILKKYGIKQERKTRQILHNISKKLVSEKKQLIVENLTGIREKFRKGNKQSKKFRSMLNGWPFYEFRRQLEYKSIWHNGFSVIKVKPYLTSAKCSICGALVIPEENRQIRCQCGHIEHRDVNAARNILYKGALVVQPRGLWLRPNALQNEAMKQLKNAKQIVVSDLNDIN
ncbi:MAG: transposase [Thermoproteota archaeon]